MGLLKGLYIGTFGFIYGMILFIIDIITDYKSFLQTYDNELEAFGFAIGVVLLFIITFMIIANSIISYM